MLYHLNYLLLQKLDGGYIFFDANLNDFVFLILLLLAMLHHESNLEKNNSHHMQ